MRKARLGCIWDTYCPITALVLFVGATYTNELAFFGFSDCVRSSFSAFLQVYLCDLSNTPLFFSSRPAAIAAANGATLSRLAMLSQPPPHEVIAVVVVAALLEKRVIAWTALKSPPRSRRWWRCLDLAHGKALRYCLPACLLTSIALATFNTCN
jgi:hypothetical protein